MSERSRSPPYVGMTEGKPDESMGEPLAGAEGETTGVVSIAEGETTGVVSIADGETTGVVGGGGGGSGGGSGAGVVWAGVVFVGVVGAAECDFVGVGVGVGVGRLFSAGPINGIRVSDSFVFALLEGFADGVAVGGRDDDGPAVLLAFAVNEAVVTVGSGATEGLSTLNCGGAPPS